MKVCAVIPAYNESRTIGNVVRKTRPYVDKVIVVDDGSTDDTATLAEQNDAEVIKHSYNIGIGNAQQSGYDAAISEGFDYIVQLDGDEQHDPKYIPQMLKTAMECDMVIGSRFLNESYKDYPFIRRLGISFFTTVVKLLGRVNITDVTSGYRVYRCESLKRLSRLPKKHWALWQTMEAAKKSFRIKDVCVEMPLRKDGSSQFSLIRYGLYPIRMLWLMSKVMLFK